MKYLDSDKIKQLMVAAAGMPAAINFGGLGARPGQYDIREGMIVGGPRAHKTGRLYRSNGKRECARRLKQTARP